MITPPDMQYSEATCQTLPADRAGLHHWQGTLRASDGLRLAVREWWRPDVPARLCVVLSHGLGEHGGRYAHVAAAWAAAGCHVVAADHRGFGQSEGHRGHARALDHLLDDLDDVCALAQARHPALPLALVGHSMGGLIALAQTIRQQAQSGGLAQPWGASSQPVPVCCLVLSAAAVTLSSVASVPERAVGAVMDRVWPSFTLRRPADGSRLSRDPAVHDAWISDPLCHGAITARLYADVFVRGGAACHRYASAVQVPVLLVHGTADPLIPASSSQQLYEAFPTSDKALRLYEDMRHEVLNEVGNERPIADISAWLIEHTPTQ